MDSMRGESGAAVAAVKTRLEELNETGIIVTGAEWKRTRRAHGTNEDHT